MSKRHLISSSADGTLIVWDTAARRPYRTLKGHAKSKFGVLGVRASPSDSWIVSWANDRTARLWDPRSGKEIRTLAEAHHAVAGVAFHPQKMQVAVVLDGKIRVVDLDDGSTVVEIPAQTSAAGQRARGSIQFTANGSQIVCLSDSATVEVFNAADGKRLREWNVAPLKEGVYDAGGLKRSPKGERFGFVYKDYVCVSVMTDGKDTRRIEIDGGVNSFAWTPQGDEVVVAAGAGIGRWSVNGKQSWYAAFKRADGSPMTVAYDADGDLIAEGGSAKIVNLRAADSGRVVSTLKGHVKTVTDLDYVAM